MEGKIREPAVAGQFYSSNATELRANVTGYLSHWKPTEYRQQVRAVIVPHAGYVFSGDMAAAAYASIAPATRYEHIFLLGPSHHVYLNRVAVDTGHDAYATPLGVARVDTALCRQLMQADSVFTDNNKAHEKEHCLEVQLPFLQTQLDSLPPIVPLVFATQSLPKLKAAARALQPYFNAHNLFVVSSDFSHYPSYDDANRVDSLTGQAIMTGKAEQFIQVLHDNNARGIERLVTSACGEAAIVTLLMMAEKEVGIAIRHAGYRNSGDSDYGGKRQVVGYHAFVFAEDTTLSLSASEKETLKAIARNAILAAFDRQTGTTPSLTPHLRLKCGAFVTLHLNGRLRGCIGHFGQDLPLHQSVRQMAYAAAFEDPRFPPVSKVEVDQLDIEISVLTPMRRIRSIDEFYPARHGIYIRRGHRSGTFLPQVAQETQWTKEELLGHCAQDKAGIGWDGWRDAELYVYEAIVF